MKRTVIFLGTPEFALPSLQALINDQETEVTLVITQPDRPVGRKRVLTPSPVKVLAQEYGIPVWQPEKLNAELEQLLSYDRPDYLVVVAYGQILAQDVLDFPTVAPLNVHASLLPHLRGAAPIHFALWQGDTVTGVSVQRMVYQLDAGDVLHCISSAILERDTTPELYERLSDIGAVALMETFNKIDEHGIDAIAIPQDASKVTHCRMLQKSDGQIDHTQVTALELDRMVRALNPWPGVWTQLEGQPVKILTAALEPTEHAYALECRDATVLYLLAVQRPGGVVKGGDSLKKNRLRWSIGSLTWLLMSRRADILSYLC